jgi:FkbM family methyltransferase
MGMEFFIYASPAFDTFLGNNPHERGEVNFLNSIVVEGMKVIDIGANIGISSVTIATKIGGRGKLYSFEPLPQYFDILNKNISSNGLENVEAYALAVTDQVARAPFYDKGLSSGIVFEEGAKKSEVPTTTIDGFVNEQKIQRIDLINMDCEGSELLVLKGAKETLRKNKVRIFCEIHHNFLRQLGQSTEDLVEYLQKLGFEVQSVCLNDLKVGDNFKKCEYIYAHNLNERRNYAYPSL